MNDLQIIKSEHFGNVTADIYSNSEEMFMTANQLAECLEYTSKSAFDSLISRNPYIKDKEFSGTCVLQVPQGDGFSSQKTRLFNEDGIYEITMLSKSEKAKEFRRWIRTVLKQLRKTGSYSMKRDDHSKLLEIKEMNARARLSNQFLKLTKVETLSTEYKNILVVKATEILTGTQLLPLPKSKQKTYSATELGEMFGVSKQKIGSITTKYNLKTDEYGEYYRSKSQFSNKEVDTFVYFDSIIPVLESILGRQQAV